MINKVFDNNIDKKLIKNNQNNKKAKITKIDFNKWSRMTSFIIKKYNQLSLS